MAKQGVIERYRKFLPGTKKTPVITLGEGDTPLVRAARLAREIGFLGVLWLKFEGTNPTGSFKDRGMTVAISRAVEKGASAVICASTGNTLASAAAYSAKAGIRCIGLLPYGNVAAGKLMQSLMHGASVIQIRGNFDDAQRVAIYISEHYPVVLVNSLNMDRLHGQKTAAFEICDRLRRAPDYHFIPVGNGGNITAYNMGYKEWCKNRKKSPFLWLTLGNIELHWEWDEVRDTFTRSVIPPVMMGYQAEGAAPIVLGRPVKDPETIATAIMVGNPARWKEAKAAAENSGGRIDCVSDEEIIRAYKQIPELSGIGCEPASAASVAGLAKAVRNGHIKNTEGTIVVCTLTGHILKDPDTALEVTEKPVVLGADPKAIARFLKL